MTVMVVLNMIWAFLSAHWHKIVGVIAFFLAAYNKYQHNKLLDAMATISTTKQSKSKKSKFKKSKK